MGNHIYKPKSSRCTILEEFLEIYAISLDTGFPAGETVIERGLKISGRAKKRFGDTKIFTSSLVEKDDKFHLDESSDLLRYERRMDPISGYHVNIFKDYWVIACIMHNVITCTTADICVVLQHWFELSITFILYEQISFHIFTV